MIVSGRRVCVCLFEHGLGCQFIANHLRLGRQDKEINRWIVYTRTLTLTLTLTHTCTHTRTHLAVLEYTQIHTCTHTHTRTHSLEYTRIHVHARAHVHTVSCTRTNTLMTHAHTYVHVRCLTECVFSVVLYTRPM